MTSYEFYRVFSFMSGMTTNAYIRNRKLSLAGQELFEIDEKVIDTALKYGYDTLKLGIKFGMLLQKLMLYSNVSERMEIVLVICSQDFMKNFYHRCDMKLWIPLTMKSILKKENQEFFVNYGYQLRKNSLLRKSY